MEYKTWKRRIVEVMQKEPEKWRTFNQIKKRLGLTWRNGNIYCAVNSYLVRLTEDGVVQRSRIKSNMFKHIGLQTKYAYKLTGKEFKDGYNRLNSYKVR